jgi:hypothetical protein
MCGIPKSQKTTLYAHGQLASMNDSIYIVLYNTIYPEATYISRVSPNVSLAIRM